MAGLPIAAGGRWLLAAWWGLWRADADARVATC
jgi:hypothetical protein